MEKTIVGFNKWIDRFPNRTRDNCYIAACILALVFLCLPHSWYTSTGILVLIVFAIQRGFYLVDRDSYEI